MPRKIFLLLAVFSLLYVTGIYTADAQDLKLDAALAKRYFAEEKELCGREGGKLWGMPIYGPLLFVDACTHSVIANQPGDANQLREQDGVFIGELPKEIPAANTSIEWAGVKWAMIIWPLPEDRRARLRLITHELFHRLQGSLNLASGDPANQQLDEKQGRIWLRLEMKALEQALYLTGSARSQAITDALYFRSRRQSIYPESAAEEDSLELNEGLAEYTGLKVSARWQNELLSLVTAALREGQHKNSYSRSFAYLTGPAIGYLLDEAGQRWRATVAARKSLAGLLSDHYAIKLPASSEQAALARAQDYDGEEIIAAETARDQRQQELLARYRAKFIDGPLLILPVSGKINYSFDPNNVFNIAGAGSIYGRLEVSDDWGILTVNEGALLYRQDGRLSKIQLAAPADTKGREISGNGWKLELNTGWQIVTGTRPGDFTLRKD